MKGMNGIEKAAILFRALGSEAANVLCDSMRPEEVSLVGATMVRLDRDPPAREVVEQVLAEFREMLDRGRSIFVSVNETLEEMFEKKFGKEGKRILEEVRLNAQIESPFSGLAGVPYSDLERILREEHPQVQAAVLANIGAELAAGVLRCMDERARADMIERIATMRPPPARLLRDIADLFIKKTAKLPRFEEVERKSGSANVKRAADILNAASGTDNQAVLDAIGQDKPDLVQEIRETMFSFEDLARVDKLNMQKILGGIDTKLLALALKSCSEPVAQAIFQAVSQRTRDMIVEERELMGAVPLAEVRAAQKEIMATIRQMIDEGSVKVTVGAGDGELVQ